MGAHDSTLQSDVTEAKIRDDSKASNSAVILESGKLVAEGILADQDALDDIPVGIYVIEKDGTLITCNKTAIGAWGRTPAWAHQRNTVGRTFCAIRRARSCRTLLLRRRW